MNNHKTVPAGKFGLCFSSLLFVNKDGEMGCRCVIVTHSELLHTGLRCFYGRQKGKVGRKHISIVSKLEDRVKNEL